MITVFIGICILIVWWYAQISNYITHLLPVASLICVVSLIMIGIGGVASLFLDMPFWRTIVLPFITFDILIIISHLI
ncbi:MAG: hypothetical protein AAF485_15725, partial [Chloroflexota bacterium]